MNPDQNSLLKMADRRHWWFAFCDRHGLGSNRVPLFETEAGIVSTVPLGRNQAPVLKRSEGMERLVLDQVKLVHEDFRTSANAGLGVIGAADMHLAAVELAMAQPFGHRLRRTKALPLSSHPPTSNV